MVVETVRGTALAARVGARIKRLRKHLQMSQERLAHQAAYDRATIAAIETGRALPSVAKLVDLATALGVSPNVLLEEEVPLGEGSAPVFLPLPTWSPAERRAMLRSLRRLVAALEESASSA